MGLILGSFILIILSALVVMLSINYAWVIWEKQRVTDLTSKIKPSDASDILSKSALHKEFTTSFDLRSIGKSGIHKAQNVYEKTMVALKDNSYPSWFSRFIASITAIRSNIWLSVQSSIQYLLHLAKPDVYQDPEQVKTIDRTRGEYLEDIERVKQVNTQTSEKPEEKAVISTKADDTLVPEKEIVKTEIVTPYHQFSNYLSTTSSNSDEVADSEISGDATLNLASSTTNTPNPMFEKLEARILDKLQQSGLKNYDIWLELGELYIKYEEKNKAGQIFALVLKHTHDEKQKEMATNRLIGL